MHHMKLNTYICEMCKMSILYKNHPWVFSKDSIFESTGYLPASYSCAYTMDIKYKKITDHKSYKPFPLSMWNYNI